MKRGHQLFRYVLGTFDAKESSKCDPDCGVCRTEITRSDSFLQQNRCYFIFRPAIVNNI